MGGLDVLDSLLSYYLIPVKPKKWYHRLIWHLLESMLCQKKATRGRPPRLSTDASHSAKAKKGPAKPIPSRSIRTDGYKHWP